MFGFQRLLAQGLSACSGGMALEAENQSYCGNLH